MIRMGDYVGAITRIAVALLVALALGLVMLAGLAERKPDPTGRRPRSGAVTAPIGAAPRMATPSKDEEGRLAPTLTFQVNHKGRAGDRDEADEDDERGADTKGRGHQAGMPAMRAAQNLVGHGVVCSKSASLLAIRGADGQVRRVVVPVDTRVTGQRRLFESIALGDVVDVVRDANADGSITARHIDVVRAGH